MKTAIHRKGSKGVMLPIANEMPILRGCGRPLFRRLLVLMIGAAILTLMVTFYQTMESSYLDLMDSLLDSSAIHSDFEDTATTPSHFQSSDDASYKLCKDESGWIEEWISSGVMPRCSLAHKSKIDVLYTWVNGSEILYQQEKKIWQDKSPVFGVDGFQHDRKIRATERRHREHDELRYSIRSIFKYLESGFSHIRILASDFYEESSATWIGQTPSWLDLGAAKRHGVSIVYTSELYGPRKSLLPVFNSLALESQFYNLPSLPDGNEVMLYLNDDMFLANKHSVSDFWNPIIGVNIQMDNSILVGNLDASLEQFQTDWNSEWTALRYTNFFLSKRFGWRRRPYLAHHGKSVSRQVLEDIVREFPNEVNETSMHRFRSEGKDINTIFLHMHYILERHREVLLESYLVHRSDANGDGVLDMEERKVLLTHVQTALKENVVRQTLQEQVTAMHTANLSLPQVSTLRWSSSDGYPFAFKIPSNPITGEDIKAPDEPMYFVDDPPHTRIPEYDFVEMCLTPDFVRSSLADAKVDTQVLFQLLSKEYPYCGDMLLAILITSSPLGLHHLLPSPSHPKYSYLTHQLHKYAYTISDTASEFIMANSAEGLKKGFVRALKTLKHNNLAQICVNDDYEFNNPVAIQNFDSTFKGIMQGYFGGLTADGGRSPVEKVDSVGNITEEGRQFWLSASYKGGPGYE